MNTIEQQTECSYNGYDKSYGVHYYTDNLTGSTFIIHNDNNTPEAIIKRRDEIRERFREAGNL